VAIPEGVAMTEISGGDTAWMLISTALVLLMTPGLAFFYGGLVRAKSVLNMMMMSFISIGVVSVVWVFYGFSLAFGDSGGGLYGAFEFNALGDVAESLANNGGEIPIPLLVFAAFQLMFAILTPALISGAIADRAKFSAWAVFVLLWVSIVYFPVAHWVFDFGTVGADDSVVGAGWLAELGVVDFAGGTAVHINAGAAALALVIVLGKRVGFRRDPMRPHNLPFVLLGAGLLWFGWFGFNAGSALGAGPTAAVALFNTQVATGAAVLGWLIVERLRDGHATSLGAASGAIAGLVAITPACASVTPAGAVALGLVAGALCALAVSLKYKLGYDDSLDVVGVHLVGGLVGSLAIGVIAVDGGAFYGGGWSLLGIQAIGSFSVLAYSFIVTLIIGYAIKATIGFRVTRDEEVEGIDVVEHAESAYEFENRGGGVGSSALSARGTKEGVSA
jgi:ammonium transporter, Amt family